MPNRAYNNSGKAYYCLKCEESSSISRDLENIQLNSPDNSKSSNNSELLKSSSMNMDIIPVSTEMVYNKLSSHLREFQTLTKVMNNINELFVCCVITIIIIVDIYVCAICEGDYMVCFDLGSYKVQGITLNKQ